MLWLTKQLENFDYWKVIKICHLSNKKKEFRNFASQIDALGKRTIRRFEIFGKNQNLLYSTLQKNIEKNGQKGKICLLFMIYDWPRSFIFSFAYIYQSSDLLCSTPTHSEVNNLSPCVVKYVMAVWKVDYLPLFTPPLKTMLYNDITKLVFRLALN